MPKRIAAIVGLILFTAVLVLLDLSVSTFASPNSWASLIRDGFRTQPALAWVVGVVIGHLYHPFGEAGTRQDLPPPLDILVDPLGRWPFLRIGIAVGASTLVVVLFALVLKLLGAHLPVWPFGLAGIVFGAFMWPTSFTAD